MRVNTKVGEGRGERWRRSCLATVVALVLLLPSNGRAQEPTKYQVAVAMQEAMIDAIAKAERSVVAIARVRKGQRGIASQTTRNEFPLDRMSVPILSVSPTNPDFVPNEFATGVVIDRQGHILTNYHVLGDPEENDYYVWVQRRPFRATRVEVPQEVRAGDPWTDLAVLKVSAENLEPIALGDASKLRKGMIVVSLGNPYGIARDGEASASWGIISNLRRTAPGKDQSNRFGADVQSLHQFGTLIQTDARLHLGTSGGALVNLKGEMIGLTTSLAAMTGYEQPAGFAIPVDDAFRKTINTLKQGRVPSYGFLGVQPEHLSVAERQAGKFGAQVSYVVPGTPADQAGLREEDVITHINGEKVYDKNTLFRELSRLPAESKIKLTLNRRRRTTTANVVLSKRYVETAQKAFAQVKDPEWRGLRVEYPSALPPQWNTVGALAVDPDGCVAVLAVERDSPAWKAGLRRGQYISHVGLQRVATPKEFYAAVADENREVRLHMTAARGDDAVRTVPAGD
jgi:serine protease Do